MFPNPTANPALFPDCACYCGDYTPDTGLVKRPQTDYVCFVEISSNNTEGSRIMSGRSNLLDLDFQVLVNRPQDNAILVLNEDGNKVWLPKSQIEVEDTGDGRAIITLPEWLAIEKHLV